jgi:RNA polymerase sigma-70 factor (ECF subfamily)
VRTFEDEAVFWSWLTVLARSAVADHGRKHRRYFAFLERFFRHSAVEEREFGDADARLLELLEEGLQALPPDERWLVEQKYLANRGVREMAVSMQVTEKAVEGKLGRVRRKLRAAVLEKLNHEKDA